MPETSIERQPASGSLSQADHDTLVELKTLFKTFVEQYKIDMKDLQDGIKTRVDDHELRVKKIENDLIAIGGVHEAWKRFLVVEKWSQEFQLKWKTVIGVGVTIGSTVTFILGIIAKIAGLL